MPLPHPHAVQLYWLRKKHPGNALAARIELKHLAIWKPKG